MSRGEMSFGEKRRREKRLFGRNVAPVQILKKSGEKHQLGRNVAGRNVAGRNVTWGETSFLHNLELVKNIPQGERLLGKCVSITNHTLYNDILKIVLSLNCNEVSDESRRNKKARQCNVRQSFLGMHKIWKTGVQKTPLEVLHINPGFFMTLNLFCFWRFRKKIWHESHLLLLFQALKSTLMLGLPQTNPSLKEDLR